MSETVQNPSTSASSVPTLCRNGCSFFGSAIPPRFASLPAPPACRLPSISELTSLPSLPL